MMGRSKPDPCQKFACALQACLQASDFQEWKCVPAMDALYECCSRADKHSVVCSGIRPKETAGHSSQLKFKHGKIIPEQNIN